MKKIIYLIFAILVLSLSVFADGEYAGRSIIEGEYYLAISDGDILSQKHYEPSWITKIFQPQGFNFVDANVENKENYLCNLKDTHGTFDKPVGKSINSGAQCDVGDFIAYRSEGGDIGAGTYLFEQLWKKTSSDDLPNLNNYWTADKSFTYTYYCYSCDIELEDNFEHGCLTKDKTECVSASSSSCDYDYKYEKVCLEHIGESSNDLDITLQDIKVTNNGDLTLNQKYSITGKAKIEGKCEGCVIETGQGYYGSKQSFSIVSNEETKNACGDDLTVGIKFDAIDEWVEFKIDDIATKEGTYNIEIAAYNGCYEEKKSEFKKLDSKTFNINVQEAPEEVPDVDEDESNDVTCKFCQVDKLRTAVYDIECPEGTIPESVYLECGTEIDPIICSNDPDSESCKTDELTDNDPIYPIPGPEEDYSFIDEYLDFENNPTTAYGLIIVAILIILLAIIIGYDIVGK